MNITLQCDISLSKKLRQLVGNGAKVSLLLDNVQEGRGVGRLLLVTESESDIKSILDKETSIMMTPREIVEEVPQGVAVSNIFSPRNPIVKNSNRTPVDKIAIMEPPQSSYEVSHAFKVDNENSTPDSFKEVNEPSYRKYISDLKTLMEAVSESLHKVSNIDLSSIADPRKRAVAMENKERAESIGVPSFVVNTSCASLAINDLGLGLMLNVPCNLGNISAKRLAESKDLGAMLRAGYIKFITPDEVELYVNKTKVDKFNSGLFVGSRKEAEAAIETEGHNANEMEVSVDEIDDMTEEQRLSTNLTPINSASSGDGGLRRSSHGVSSYREKKHVPAASVENKAGIKTIRKL